MRRISTSALYKNEATGDTRVFPKRVKKFTDEAGQWVRIPRPKPPTRSDRRDSIVSTLQTCKDVIEEVQSMLDGDDPLTVWATEIVPLHAQMDVSGCGDEVSELLDELTSWKDNLPENLQYSNKADELDSAISELESAQSSLEEIDTEDIDKYMEMEEPDIEGLRDALTTLMEALDGAMDSLDQVEFPGMF